MSNKLRQFALTRFAGINTRTSKFLIADEQCQDILNLVFDEWGALAKISGFSKWNSTSLGASTMLGGARFYRTGATAEFVQAHNGKIYKGTAGAFTEIATGLNTTAKYRMLGYRDLLFMLNGTDEAKKWNGTTVTKTGVVAPTTAITAADGGAGTLSGTYTWVFTFVTPTMESNQTSTASNSLTITSKQASLTGVAVSADTQVTKRRIYRTAAGGTDYKYVGEIADNTTTTFTDNVADASLGVTVPTGKNVITSGLKYLELHKNRLWASGETTNPRRVYYSEIFEPEAWPTANYVDIPMDAGDEVTGIKVLGDFLVVYGHNTPFLIIGETPNDFAAKKSLATVGCESDRTLTNVENVHLYLGRSGVYAFDGSTQRLLSEDIETIIDDISQSNIGNSAAAYHQKTKLWRCSVTRSGAATNAREIVLDFRTRSWTLTDRTIAYYHNLNGPGDQGELFSASPTVGHLFQEDTGTTADGGGITARWKSKAFGLDSLNHPKFLRYFISHLEPPTEIPAIQVRMDDLGARTQTFALTSGTTSSVYGTGVYGTAIYSERLTNIVRNALPFQQKMVGYYYEIEFETTTTKAVRVFDFTIAYWLHLHYRLK